MPQVLAHVGRRHSGDAPVEQVLGELDLAVDRLGEHVAYLLFHLGVKQIRLLGADLLDHVEGAVPPGLGPPHAGRHAARWQVFGLVGMVHRLPAVASQARAQCS